MLGKMLADRIGASALLYAAVAYFVFDESFYIDDMLEHHPELHEEIMWWLEDICPTFYDLFTNLRTYYEPAASSTETSPARFELLAVRYTEPDEEILIVATRDPRDHHFGNQWRVFTQC